MIPVPNTFRMCTKDYVVPGTDFTIPKGTKVIIPIVSKQLLKFSKLYLEGGFAL